MSSIGDDAVMSPRAQAIEIVIEQRRHLFQRWLMGRRDEDLMRWDRMNRIIRYLTDPETVEAEWRAHHGLP